MVILLGNFRQTCPVIRRGSRVQVVAAFIKSSPLWPLFTIHQLTVPIRNAQDPDYVAFVNAIGDGAGPDIDLNIIDKVSSPEELINPCTSGIVPPSFYPCSHKPAN